MFADAFTVLDEGNWVSEDVKNYWLAYAQTLPPHVQDKLLRDRSTALTVTARLFLYKFSSSNLWDPRCKQIALDTSQSWKRILEPDNWDTANPLTNFYLACPEYSPLLPFRSLSTYNNIHSYKQVSIRFFLEDHD